MPTLYKIRGFTPTDSAITLYTHKLWHRRYFLNREVPYWLQSSITGSAFRGLLLILQKNSMLTDTKIFRSRMGAFRCIVRAYTLTVSRSESYKVKVVLGVCCALIGSSHSSCGRTGLKIERAVIHFHPMFTCPGHSSDMSHVTIDPCTGQSAGSVRANRIV